MSKISKNVSRYLINRQRRAARLEAFGRAEEAGLVESQQLGETPRSGAIWQLTADQASRFTGDIDHDRELIRTGLEAAAKNSTRAGLKDEADGFDEFSEFRNFDGTDECPEVGDVSHIGQSGGQSRFFPADGAREGDQPGTMLAGPSAVSARNPLPPEYLAVRRKDVLTLIEGFAPNLKPAEVTTALLIAKALGRDERALDRLFAAMRRKNAIIAVHIPVHDFVRQFGVMLEVGLILPFYTSLGSIARGPTLSGRHKALADSKRRKSFECLKGSLARRLDDEELRQLVSKNVLGLSKPLIIADANPEPLPSRLTAAADIMIEGDGIDASLVVDVLSICCGIPVTRSDFLMTEVGFEPRHLGIDDLAVAIRPGRSLTKMIGVLMTLEADNAANADDEDNNKPGRLTSSNSPARSALSSNRKKYVGCFDVIEPLASAAAPKSGTPSDVKQPAQPAKGKDQLLVEQLAGYGEARQWALDLKSDLQAFRNEDVDWSDLSSRLLLSGPPGTGKTTFARALCNTLQVPLVATSVARWLEASHLGDVLAAIGATFDHVSQNAPCILFIDEIDNIGSRNGGVGRNYDDYWASLVNRLLELLDGASKTQGVIIVGATNRPEKIDPALLRSGRLEKHILIPPPDTAALIGIIAHHLGSDLDAVLNSSDASLIASLSDAPKGRVDATAKQAVQSSTGSEPDEGSSQFDDNQKEVSAHG